MPIGEKTNMENSNSIIKFRAWDKLKKELVNIELWDFRQKGCDCRTSNGKGWYTPICNLEIMQYTGLKDKNGKEIYEGDIVDYDGQGIEGVGYDNGCFWVGLKSPIPALLFKQTKFCKVIGNIYENYNLIK
jgi:hypothetical protein